MNACQAPLQIVHHVSSRGVHQLNALFALRSVFDIKSFSINAVVSHAMLKARIHNPEPVLQMRHLYSERFLSTFEKSPGIFQLPLASACLKSASSTTAAASSTESTASSSATPWSAASTASTGLLNCLLSCLVLRLWRVVDQEGVEWERVWEDEVSDGRSAQVDGVECDWVAAACSHLDSAECSVHLRGDRCNGAVNDCAYAWLACRLNQQCEVVLRMSSVGAYCRCIVKR